MRPRPAITSSKASTRPDRMAVASTLASDSTMAKRPLAWYARRSESATSKPGAAAH